MTERTVAGTTFSTGDSVQAFPIGGATTVLALSPGVVTALPDDVLASDAGLALIYIPVDRLVWIGDADRQAYPLPLGDMVFSINSNTRETVRFQLDVSATDPVVLPILLSSSGR